MEANHGQKLPRGASLAYGRGKGKARLSFSLPHGRAFSKAELSKFWEEYLRLDMPQLYKVDLSEKLHALKSRMLDEIRGGTGGEKE